MFSLYVSMGGTMHSDCLLHFFLILRLACLYQRLGFIAFLATDVDGLALPLMYLGTAGGRKSHVYDLDAMDSPR